MTSPRISIAVLCYNYGRYLGEALDSVLRQSFTDWEAIVIDDGSSDDTPAVAARYAGDPRVRIVRHQPNRGFSASLIEGTESLARGELRMCLSADDRIDDPEALSRQVALFDREPGLAMVFSGYRKFDETRPDWEEVVTPIAGDRVLSSRDAFRLLLASRTVHPPASGTMFTAAAYRGAGGYRRDVRYALDSVLWPLLALQGPVAYLDAPLYGYRIHGGQMSQSVAVGRRHLGELMFGIDLAAAMAVKRDPDPDWAREVAALRRDARDFKIGAVAMDHAYGGRRAVAMKNWLSSTTYDPILAIRSRTLQSIWPRILLGGKVSASLQRAVGRHRGWAG